MFNAAIKPPTAPLLIYTIRQNCNVHEYCLYLQLEDIYTINFQPEIFRGSEWFIPEDASEARSNLICIRYLTEDS